MVLTSRNPQSGTTCDGDIDALDVGDASMPADYATYVGTARTTAKVAWSNLPSWGTNTLHSSPEIKTVIQEIVDRGDWSSGNALVTSVHDEDETSSTGARREWHSHDNDATRAAKLDIDFEAAAVTVGEMMAARMMGPPMTPPVPAEVVAY
jgi:type IV pilus assembly protein PilY1